MGRCGMVGMFAVLLGCAAWTAGAADSASEPAEITPLVIMIEDDAVKTPSGEPVMVVIEEDSAVRKKDKENYEVLLLSIWKGIPDSTLRVPVYGVKLGILGTGGAEVYGIEAAVIASQSSFVRGFKGSLIFTQGVNVEGVVLSPVNAVRRVDGLSIGAFNIAESAMFQIGIINYMEDGFLPAFPLFNFRTR
ncbi:MAG: hypothetical protein PHI35_04280 [Victivallaceae bacterium]|nr:hypothetical protein [Victivallaceae bacterium]